MNRSDHILRLLSDGRFHSGEELAGHLGCTRSAIWKQVKQLRDQTALHIDSVTGRGYRLRRPLRLLDREQIVGRLSDSSAQDLQACHVLGSVTSTNALALASSPAMQGPAAAWFAEHQTEGRGRRGRTWISPYGRNLYFSLAYRFDLPMTRLSGLSIASGAVLAGVLSRHGLQGHALKWPNDLLWQSRKLAGILLEAFGESDGPACAVIGIGVNLDLGRDAAQQIDQPAVCMREAGVDVDRNQLAGDLLDAALQMCRRFATHGLAPFAESWRDYDAYQGEQVRLLGATSELRGQCLGIADDGGLRLRVGSETNTYYAGELSLRAAHGE